MLKEDSDKKSHVSVSQTVSELAKPFADSLNFEIWDVKFLKEGPNHILRIFIDKPEGITLDDCEAMSRAIDEPLDLLDPIPVSYSLEVCSPGLDRELSKDEHFQKFTGSEVKVKLIRPDENGEKDLIGILDSFDKDSISIKAQNGIIEKLERKNISHINLNY